LIGSALDDREVRHATTDILIIGSGGAGLYAALHAKDAAPDLRVTVAVKGLLGKCGCTRMVQGGYNVALADDDSLERHFMDTIEGGQWLNDQELVWELVHGARERILELENRYGCFFDRHPDGTVHQKAFAGQTYDRTVHKGDLTGIEIINRLVEQARAQGVEELEDHRAVALIKDRQRQALAGMLMVDMRSGAFTFIRARAVLLATGGGPTMYRYHTPSGDKSCDGLAMALAAGLSVRDIEMVQFHPTGLLAGPHTRMTGTVLEEGLRGAGGFLLDGKGERFMQRYDPRAERATRDLVSRAMYEQMKAGNTTPLGGLYIQMNHLPGERVRKQFKGMVDRCADCGFDLVNERVEVVPTAHYLMGGIEFHADCSTQLPGLFVAGEDAGGVHGANRLGGNGVANSTVFGAIAGKHMAAYGGEWLEPDQDEIASQVEACLLPFRSTPGSIESVRERLYDIMWDQVGIVRDAEGLSAAERDLKILSTELASIGITGDSRAYHLGWHDWLNLENLIMVSRCITAAATARENSCGAHYRSDFTEPPSREDLSYICVSLHLDQFSVQNKKVVFSKVRPGQSLLVDQNSSTQTAS